MTAPDSDAERLTTCPKCGVQAVAFICSERGCPVNGGAAYGPEASTDSDAERLTDEQHREWLGREVRLQWEKWAREQPDPKLAWTTPWDKLTEPQREVDRRIGDWLFRLGQRAGHYAMMVQKNRIIAERNAEITRLRSQAAPSGDVMERAREIALKLLGVVGMSAEDEAYWRSVPDRHKVKAATETIASALTSAKREATERERERCANVAHAEYEARYAQACAAARSGKHPGTILDVVRSQEICAAEAKNIENLIRAASTQDPKP